MNMDALVFRSKKERVEVVRGEMHWNTELRNARHYGRHRTPVSLAQVGQGLTQFVARPVDVRLDRTQWEVEHLGDFLVCPALDMA